MWFLLKPGEILMKGGRVEMDKVVRVGIDVGSTTAKVYFCDENGKLYADYRRHGADTRATLVAMLKQAYETLGDTSVLAAFSGSAAKALAAHVGIPFVNEIIAERDAVMKTVPDADVIVELGGEDAKVVFVSGAEEERMNTACAGGTGSFIDRMAELMKVSADDLNDLAASCHEDINGLEIASRCGVFATTDVQALLNSGISKEVVAKLILKSVVNQTVTELCQGRKLKGRLVLLGGPLTYMSELRQLFSCLPEVTETVCPEDSLYYVARGAAISDRFGEEILLSDLTERIAAVGHIFDEQKRLEPLYSSSDEYRAFKERHNKEHIVLADPGEYHGTVFMGLDFGSTTAKGIVIGQNGEVLAKWYGSNDGDVFNVAKTMLQYFYRVINSNCVIGHVTATGYGERFMTEAFRVDSGVVETIAHLMAAKAVRPDVDSVLDIGGQDIKYMSVKNGMIDKFLVNEACSSGCGVFIKTFAETMGVEMDELVRLAVKAKSPVNMGTRCTVFMNSSVKQAQKEGATLEDILAGLCIAVVRNTWEKVLRLRVSDDADDELGKTVVVQGGTFWNDAVLRAFERLSGREVIRPNIAGLMGAYGAALVAKERYQAGGQSNMVSREESESLKAKRTSVRCKGCGNACLLTINHFGGDRKFITGNACEKGAGQKVDATTPNLYAWKYERLNAYDSVPIEQARAIVGIPMALNSGYEDLPFWVTFFQQLNVSVVRSERSGCEDWRATVPSATVCYPAKLAHDHTFGLIDSLVKIKEQHQKNTFIWMPQIIYATKEDPRAQNSFLCPIVCSYSENIKNNISDLKRSGLAFVNPFISFNSTDKVLAKWLFKHLEGYVPELTRKEVLNAIQQARQEAKDFRHDLIRETERALDWAEINDKPVIVLLGRPYHVDPDINHGIPELTTSLGAVVLAPDGLMSYVQTAGKLRMMNSWAFPARELMAAAAATKLKDKKIYAVQLISFGCGLDAVVGDQIRDMLEEAGMVYTMLKIDDVKQLGPALIRIRSILTAASLGLA